MSSCLFPLILLRYPVTTQLSKQLGQRSRGEEVYKSICSLHKLQLYGNKLVRPHGFCIMFGTSFGEEKAYAWNERFGFEFLCVIFFCVCVFDNGGILRRTSGFWDSIFWLNARVHQRSLYWKVTSTPTVEVIVPMQDSKVRLKSAWRSLACICHC